MRILVYLLGVDPVTATGYSLFIVGATALFGGASLMRQGNVHWPSVIRFGAPSIFAVFATRKWVMPALPEIWFSVDGAIVTKAIGTSSIIIAAKSLIGFPGDLLEGSHMDWPLLLAFSAVAFVGILAGSSLSKRISNERLKPAFN